MALLDKLPDYAEKLDAKTVTDKIWPHLVRKPCDTLGRITVEQMYSKPALQTLSR